MTERERLTEDELIKTHDEELVQEYKEMIKESIEICREFEGCLLDGLEDEEYMSNLETNIRSKVVDTLKTAHTITINDVATLIGLKESEKELPNGRKVKSVEWSPKNLEPAYKTVDGLRSEAGLGRNDCVTIDGGSPTFVLPTVSHAFHPSYTAYNMPQQTGDKIAVPLSGAQVEGEGAGQDLNYEITEKDDYVVVEFKLDKPQIDVMETVKTLKAPETPGGKGVCITGRGPVAIATALAEAYAHKAPFVANFVPGLGYVVSISHDKNNPLGTVIENNN